MRAAYFDCFSGISGNMALAAVIDAGVSPALIRADVRKVIPDFRLAVKKDERGHLAGTHVRVQFNPQGQPERRLAQIQKMIVQSRLAEPVRRQSLLVFQRLAAAEAKVHHSTPEKIHFHEVGAVDAIVDVVGTVAGLHRLGINRVVCSPLPLSGGEVECAHGILPLPAPAVMELVRGVPIKGMPGDTELVTPTGAALATTLADSFGPMPSMMVEKIGTGLGDRDLHGRPNIMRLMVGELATEGETVFQIEAAIDDMSAEHFDFLMEKLHAAGALEVLFLPAQMKKNRPGTMVRALVGAEAREKAIAVFFNHSTTLGVRYYEVLRSALPRQSLTVSTPFGQVKVKLAKRPDGGLRSHLEYDDLKRAALRSGVSLERVEKAAREALRRRRAGKE